MQMIRARCAKCDWVFDIMAIPAPALRMKVVGKAHCPMCCNVKGNLMADPRPLTEAEAEHHKSAIMYFTEASKT